MFDETDIKRKYVPKGALRSEVATILAPVAKQPARPGAQETPQPAWVPSALLRAGAGQVYSCLGLCPAGEHLTCRESIG